MRVILDTNVFISGIVYGGAPEEIIKLWLKDKFTLCLSPQLKFEILDKLKNKFFLPIKRLNKIEKALDTKCLKLVPKIRVTICKDPKDNFLFELAHISNADVLISGDKKVLDIKKYKNTKIISVKKFLVV